MPALRPRVHTSRQSLDTKSYNTGIETSFTRGSLEVISMHVRTCRVSQQRVHPLATVCMHARCTIRMGAYGAWDGMYWTYRA